MAMAILDARLSLASKTTNTSRPLIRVATTLSRWRSSGLTRSTTIPVRGLIASSLGSASTRSAISAGRPRDTSESTTFFMPGMAFFIMALCCAFMPSMIASRSGSPFGIEASLVMRCLICAHSASASRLAFAAGSTAFQNSSFGAVVARP